MDATLAQRRPDLSFLVPAANENRWRDLLATLISTDPAPMKVFLGEEPDTVSREVPIPGPTDRSSDRLDLLLACAGRPLAAIETKLFADLGPRQLERYEAAFPDAASHLVLHLEALPLHLGSAPAWRSLTWESVLGAYAASMHPWVATTAAAWRRQLGKLVPKVDSETVWSHVPDDVAGFELALRARTAWLARRMDAWCDLEHDLLLSSGGGAWVAAMKADALSPGHQVIAEVQEGLPAQAWRRDDDQPYRTRLKGPITLVGLRQTGVSTSADFDWSLLHRGFKAQVVDGAGHAARRLTREPVAGSQQFTRWGIGIQEFS